MTKATNLTLKEVLKKEKIKEAYITYRYFFRGSDELFGICEYKEGKLKSLDGDSYDLEDEILKYEVDKKTFKNEPINLIVWIPITFEKG